MTLTPKSANPLTLLRQAAWGQSLPDDLTPEERRLLAAPVTARLLLAALTRARPELLTLPAPAAIQLPHGRHAAQAVAFPDLDAIAPPQLSCGRTFVPGAERGNAYEDLGRA